ncbi:uncharacterized protein TNCV_4216801 [Trichonephila clavipes]|nr:uncharacterized protein TNCV_4216801 [Trichonephila clavipes]
MGEVKDSNMELNDLRHGVVPVSKNLVNDMLICSSDFEGLIENSQMIRNPAKLREPSKEEGIISSTDSKSVCSQEVITNLRPETYTQSLLNVPNGDLVAVKINTSNVQTNGHGIKESKREVAFTCVFKNRILYSNRRGQPHGERFDSCQVIYSQFGLAIHQNDHQARRRFVEWAQNEIAVVPDFHQRILFSDEAPFWLNGYVNKQNCRIWSEANPQVYVETPLHPEKVTVWCALWAGGILLQKR